MRLSKKYSDSYTVTTRCFKMQMVIAAMKLKDTYSLEGKLWPTQTAY